MSIVSERTGAWAREICGTGLGIGLGVGLEGVALAGHLLLYPGGFLQPEPWPPERPQHCGHLRRSQSVAESRLGQDRADGIGGAGGGVGGDGEALGGAHAPVLLLHGLFDNRAVFTLLRHNLHVHGWDHVHALNYNPLTLDIPRAAALFGHQVEQARWIYGGERIAVVGHSLGGLIARYYVQRLGGSEHVHTLVTLGTPHQGTVAAHALRAFPIVRQLLPGSEVISELGAPAPECSTRFLCFWGGLDALILPHQHARLDHPDLATENVLVRTAGHLSLPVHWEVLTRVREALTDAQKSTPVRRVNSRQIA
ncbi:esterase/lipase family protein [Streptacidiphilus sp. MAP5-3]|uniref:esterase/lipase family protein n=1 Tax=unclassified Streptacidiphilus TaxID=2643834 RepID=UPI00351413CD